MNVTQTIILGVISGVVTSALITLVISIIRNILIPWYRSFIYRGIDISGKWQSLLEKHGVKETAILEVKQRADKVVCVMSISIEKEGKTELRVFEVEGKIEDLVLSLRGRNTNKKRIGINVALLEVVNGGKKMVGYEAWYSTITDSVDAEKIEWERVDA